MILRQEETGMILHNVGYDHQHDSDFFIERPEGSGDCLMLILKTDAIFTLGGTDVFVPANSFFLYPEGMPQYYRCLTGKPFMNDWLHFAFEEGEEDAAKALGIPFGSPVSLDYTAFYSYCIKSIANENSAQLLHAKNSIDHFFWLMLNKVSEQIQQNTSLTRNYS